MMKRFARPPPILIKTKNKVFTWVFLAKTVSLYDF